MFFNDAALTWTFTSSGLGWGSGKSSKRGGFPSVCNTAAFTGVFSAYGHYSPSRLHDGVIAAALAHNHSDSFKNDGPASFKRMLGANFLYRSISIWTVGVRRMT